MPIEFPCANPQCRFEIVVSARSEAKEFRCPNCGLVQPMPRIGPPAPAPRDAPARPPRRRLNVPQPPTPPKEHGLWGGGLRSILYAVRSLPKMLVLLLCVWGCRVLIDICLGPLRFVLSALCLFQVFIPLAAGVAAYATVGMVLRYMLDVAIGALENLPQLPELPRLTVGALFEYGVVGVGILVLYVLPVVTLPLLPLALLALAWSEDLRPFDLRWTFRAAVRFPRALAKVWALLLLWCGLLGAATLLLSRAISASIGRLLEASHGDLGTLLLASAADIAGALAVALAACVLLCVLFRCVGFWGRYCPQVLESLPEKAPSPAFVACEVAAAVATALLVHSGLFCLLHRTLV